MARENVDALRRAWNAFNEGDPSGFLDLYDAQIVLHVAPGYSLEPATVLGAAAVEKWFDDYFSAFRRGFHVEVLELIEAGDSVVTIGRPAARGRLSGVDVQGYGVADIYTFRGGKLIRIDLVGDRELALRAVGLA